MESNQLQSIKQHGEILAQSITRLSKFYEGFSTPLDTELQILRGHLAGQPNFTLAALSINKLNREIQSAQANIKKYTGDTVSQLEQAVKAYQTVFKQDIQVKQKSAQVLVALHQPIANLFALQALCVEVANLFSHIKRLPDNIDDSVKRPEDKPPSDHLYKAILAELNQLIDTYASKLPDDEQLANLRSKLAEGMTEEELLKSCLMIIRLVVNDSLSEASLTGKVIQSLHSALGSLNKNVNTSIEQSQLSFAARQRTDHQIRTQLDSIEDALKQSPSLETLKQQAQAHVSTIASSLDHREEAEKREQEALMSLLTAMQGQLVHLQKQTQFYRRKLAEQLISSHTDTLTRLPNRQAYNDRLQQEAELAQQSGLPLALAIADLDHFKSINDKFGHAAGDKTLQVVGKHFRSVLDEQDFIARWGGEEFVLLFPGTDASALVEKLELLRTTLEKIPFKFKEEKISISASFGGASFKNNESPEDVFERADKHLYQAKHSGRNCVVTDQDKS
ncbi:GGDEF domain-containing protein [Alteromonas pelagimontana]|uniref:diguanylate cyclase n=1 Tax=Alteromonas pelagimontana TaxID=1858656 RepID=A0A6M4MGK7_9ALTE|nr:GGDEF domain-containing protein [Alteromonas pelagimontana]QJR81760.1 GGDEF domain-containing protein [Alteromonas pelagimontana]